MLGTTIRRLQRPLSPSPSEHKSSWDPFVLLSCVPVVILLCFSSTNWYFDAPGFLDSFVYVGYFWHYPEHLRIFEDYYKISRLHWIIPGYICFKAFGPLVGTYVLQTLTMFLLAVSSYLAVKQTFKCSLIALACSTIMSTYTAFHGSGGWNYHMTVAGCCYFLSVAFLGAGARHQNSRLLFAAGSSLSCCLSSFVFEAIFLPSLALYYHTMLRHYKRLWRVRDYFWIACGGVVTTAGFCLINFLTGGRPDYFVPQIRAAISVYADNYWWSHWSAWLGHAPWLILPFVGVTLSVLVVVACAWRSINEKQLNLTLELSLAAQFLLSFSFAAFFDLVKHQTVFSWDYFASSLFPPAVLALAAYLSWLTPGRGKQGLDRVALLCTMLFSVSLVSVPESIRVFVKSSAAQVLPTLNVYPDLLLVGIVFVTILSSLIWRRRAGAVSIVLIGMCVTNLVAAQGLDYYKAQWKGAFHREFFETFVIADRITSFIDPTLDNIKYWYDPDERERIDGFDVPFGAGFHSFVSTRGWAGNLIGGREAEKKLPVPLERIEVRHVQGLSMLGVLSTQGHHQKTQSAVLRKLQDLGCNAGLLNQSEIKSGRIRYMLNVYALSDRKR